MPASDAIAIGTAAYRRLTLAMLFAGLATFALLYGTQPLLPEFARRFGLSAEGASLAVSLATGPLALGILVAGRVSDRLGRRPLMVAAMFAAALFSLLAGIAPNWPLLLAARVGVGLAIAGVPAVAMAYVSEEVDAGSVGTAMGLYIAGSAIGGMAGRLGVGVVAGLLGWRWALGLLAVAGLGLAEGFRRLAPPSQRFAPAPRQRGSTRALFADAALPWLFAEGAMLMGVFVTIYNYAGFRLEAPPYRLGQSAIAAVFLLYLLGSASSTWFGGMAGRIGRRRVFWVPTAVLIAGVLLTVATPLPLVVLGIALVTIGFFGAHSIASAWVGRRGAAARGQAAALYLFFYYLGSSVLGSAGGIAWTRAGWPGVAGFCLLLSCLALFGGLVLSGIPPLPDAATPPSIPAG